MGISDEEASFAMPKVAATFEFDGVIANCLQRNRWVVSSVFPSKLVGKFVEVIVLGESLICSITLVHEKAGLVNCEVTNHPHFIQ